MYARTYERSRSSLLTPPSTRMHVLAKGVDRRLELPDPLRDLGQHRLQAPPRRLGPSCLGIVYVCCMHCGLRDLMTCVPQSKASDFGDIATEAQDEAAPLSLSFPHAAVRQAKASTFGRMAAEAQGKKQRRSSPRRRRRRRRSVLGLEGRATRCRGRSQRQCRLREQVATIGGTGRRGATACGPRTIFQQCGPDHLGLWLTALSRHKMALITSQNANSPRL